MMEPWMYNMYNKRQYFDRSAIQKIGLEIIASKLLREETNTQNTILKCVKC